MPPSTAQLQAIVEGGAGVDAGYRHGPKRVASGEPLEREGLVLKWYDVHPEGLPVPGGVTALARAWLERSSLEAKGLGFVILHRCGNAFYFLIVCTWRNSNELWQTVFYKDGDAMADFALFRREGEHLPTLCVWELAPVWHEKKAWVTYLSSARDAAAAEAWLANRMNGVA